MPGSIGADLAVGTPLLMGVYYAPHSDARAGSKQISVNADPSPAVTSTYPDRGLSNTQHEIQISIRYLNPSGAYTVTMITKGSKTETLEQVGSPALDTDPRCGTADKFCTTIGLTVKTPAENPDGVLSGGPASIRICQGATCATTVFTYVGQDAYIVDGLNVTSAVSIFETPVEIYVRNLPPIDLASKVAVKLGDAFCTVTSFVRPVAPSTIWTLRTKFPPNYIPAVVTGSVYRKADGAAAGAPRCRA